MCAAFRPDAMSFFSVGSYFESRLSIPPHVALRIDITFENVTSSTLGSERSDLLKAKRRQIELGCEV